MARFYYLICSIFVVLGILTVYINIPAEHSFAKYADEGHYLGYSKYLAHVGIANYPLFFKEFLQNKENWIWPSPLRSGYFLLSSSWLKIFGENFRALALFSFICFIIFLVFSFYFARKFFGVDAAWLFVLLLAFSPLAQGLSRRALSDSLGNLFSSLSVWLFLDFLTEKKISNFIIFLLTFIYCILVREQAILLICFFALCFLIYKYIYRVKISLKYLPAIIFAPVIGVGLVWLVSSGSLTNLISLIRLTRSIPALNGYSVFFCRGPWFRYIIDYILISPITAILAFSFIIYAIQNRQTLKDPKIGYFILLALVLYLCFSIFDYNKNIRYAMIIDSVIRLFVVLILTGMVKKLRFARSFLFLAVIFLCFIDYSNFILLFCKNPIYDPVSFTLLKARHFIP